MKKIFVGPKENTIENSKFFDASITLFGSNIGNNVSFHESVTFEFWNPDNISKEIEWYNKELTKLSYPVEIMAHNPKTLFYCTFPSNVHLICKNNQTLLERLDNKIETRKLMKNIVPMLEYYTVEGTKIDDILLSSKHNDLVIQMAIGSGGSKTYLYNQMNTEQIIKGIDPRKEYSVSVYQKENVPYNIHCIIGHNQIEILPPSKQELEVSDKIEYVGSNYDIDISLSIQKKLISYSMAICQKLKKMGYLGVLGIDYIEVNGELYFIEINPRFQGSTAQVDKLLIDSNLPSIFEYNYQAFYEEKMQSAKDMIQSVW